jgi:hypothetical protein
LLLANTVTELLVLLIGVTKGGRIIPIYYEEAINKLPTVQLTVKSNMTKVVSVDLVKSQLNLEGLTVTESAVDILSGVLEPMKNEITLFGLE